MAETVAEKVPWSRSRSAVEASGRTWSVEPGSPHWAASWPRRYSTYPGSGNSPDPAVPSPPTATPPRSRSPMTTTDEIIDALRPVEDPELRRSIVDLGMVRHVEIGGGGSSVGADRPHRGRLPAAQRDHQPGHQRGHPAGRRQLGVARLHGDDRPGARGRAHHAARRSRPPRPARARRTGTPRVARCRSASRARRPVRC